MRIVQINVIASLSTGRIAVTLSRMAMQEGHRALFCFARDFAPADIPSLRIGSRISTLMHVMLARVSDRAGFYSRHATKKLVRQLQEYKPDLIHLHNLHGYYLHLPTLFQYLKTANVPVVWTLHDCWSYTGHCAYYTIAKNARPPEGDKRRHAPEIGCERWLNGCGHCPCKHNYPVSWVMDQSTRNWQDKRALFSNVPHMVLTTPSEWLTSEVKRSFMGKYPVYTLPNGIDLNTFTPCRDELFMKDVAHYYRLERVNGRHLVLSVAAVWDERKGLDDLVDLAEALGSSYCVVAVGLDEYQINSLPAMGSGKAAVKPLGLLRTGNVKELCALYTAAELYMCPSHEESMGMTLVEALACGTQVLCYQATAMPEIVTPEVGEVVPLGDIEAAAEAVRRMCAAPKSAQDCRARAAEFDSTQRFAAYMRLYENMYRYSPAYQQMLETAKGPQSAAAGKTKSEVESSSFDPHDS
ncbi:MAG: glycosyltransferase [Clostridia bacterium]